MSGIEPLTEVVGTGQFGTVQGHRIAYYKVTCRECGTIEQPEATIQMVGLYRQRHLAAHLKALAAEIADAAR
jgi:hypothetical protein